MNVWKDVAHAHFFANPNAFRFKRFYREETNQKFVERADKLYTIFFVLRKIDPTSIWHHRRALESSVSIRGVSRSDSKEE